MEQAMSNYLFISLIINFITLVLILRLSLTVTNLKNNIDEKDIEDTMRKVLDEDNIEVL